jgi:hypothetical protein
MGIDKLDIIQENCLMMVILSNGTHCWVIGNSVAKAIRLVQNQIDGEFPRVIAVCDGETMFTVMWEDEEGY